MAYLLIVDDDEDFASAAVTALECLGHEIEIEADSTKALARMNDRLPDLVILDVMFPQNARGGFELAQLLHQQTNDVGKVPILMLTAVNSEFPLGFSAADIDDRWLPVSDFLEKPVDFTVLQEKVSALLQGRGAGTGDE